MQNLLKNVLISLLVLVVCVGPSWGQAVPSGGYTDEAIQQVRSELEKSPNDVAKLTCLGKYLCRKYDKTEDESVYGEGVKVLDKALSLAPKDPVIQAFRGTISCLKARQEEDRHTAKNGLKTLDDAYQAAPTNLLIAYLNGAVCVEVPRKWGRNSDGLEKLKIVASTLEKDKAKAQELDLDLAKVYFKVAKGHQNDKDFDKATEYWQKTMDSFPKSEWAEKAKNNISRFGSGRGGWGPKGHY